MKIRVLNWKKLVSILTIFGFIFLISLILPVASTLGTTEFEIGTRFGISQLVSFPDNGFFFTSITHANIPSAPAYVGGSSPPYAVESSPTALYATWFPNEQFAIGPEFSFGRMSVSAGRWEGSETESITRLYFGGRAAYFPWSYAVSNPYVLGRVSTTILSGEGTSFFNEDETLPSFEMGLPSFGIGLGYQWRIGAAFVFRAEGQYQLLFLSDVGDYVNEFSLILGIGTRFGNSKSSTSEMPSTQ